LTPGTYLDIITIIDCNHRRMPPLEDIRMTSQRRAILEFLKSVTHHPSADEVHAAVRRRVPAISLATVYRNLETLCERGLIGKVYVAGAPKRFDADLSAHYHLRCVRCGRVEDAPGAPARALERRVRGLTDFEILGHGVEFYGLCPACRRSAGRRGRRPDGDKRPHVK
jgi:Fur family ferric uptake transcriptional regulator